MSQNVVWLVALGVGAIAGAGVMAFVVYKLGLILVRHDNDWTDALVIEGVGAIGGIGEVQSFYSLRALGLLGKLQEWEADTFPATLDIFSIVMALAALRARHEGEPDRYAEALAIIYAIAAVSGNLLLALSSVLTAHEDVFQIVAALLAHGGPPLTAILGGHWLARRFERVQKIRARLAAEARAALAAAQAALAPQPGPAPAPPPALPPGPAAGAPPPAESPVPQAPRAKVRPAAGSSESIQELRARRAWVKAVQDGVEEGWTGADIQKAAGSPTVSDRTARRWLTKFRQNRVSLLPPREAAQ